MCGIFGIMGGDDASYQTYLGLYALQHRGQESVGIVSDDKNFDFPNRVRQGLVLDVFRRDDKLEDLAGDMAIGHVRYSTKGGSTQKNAQPFIVSTRGTLFALGHNGTLTNSESLREKLEDMGAMFNTTTDTEIIPNLIARSKEETIEGRIIDALRQVEGAYSVVMLAADKNTKQRKLIAARDPHGFRPLCMGELNNRIVFASESHALDLIRANYIREINPGELVSVDHQGNIEENIEIDFSKPTRSCIFEYIYFARPDSYLFGINTEVSTVRKNLGRQLAKDNPANADLVIAVPDSGNHAAIGYAEESGIPFGFGFNRSHYMGRSFISPHEGSRSDDVYMKLSPSRETLKGKSVVVVDDSIMRGTTSRKIIKMIRNAGAKEVHMRISSPPTAYPCFYGIDTPTREELIASNMCVDDICNNVLGTDTLGYLSLNGLKTCEPKKDSFCSACFDGKYPTDVSECYEGGCGN